MQPKPLPAVQMRDGSLSKSEEDRQLCWQEHFADTFAGSIHTNVNEFVYAASSTVK